jgi:RNA polymerase sigma-70 factor (ECF subfamily)
MEALARSELDALEGLYERYKRIAFSLAYRIVGERGAAEDVLQEAFLSVWRQAGSFRRDRGTARNWLLSVVRHRAIDRIRAATSAGAHVPLDEVPDGPSDQPGVWQQVWVNVQGDTVRNALDQLPPEQKKSIELAYFSGYTQSEIAELMRVPLGTVKGRMRMALHKLKAALEGPDIGVQRA